MHYVDVEVYVRQFVPKTVRTEVFKFNYRFIGLVTQSKQELLRGCVKAFGRCTGVLRDELGRQIGWKFEGLERDDNNNIVHPKIWWETKVEITGGAINIGSLKFL